MGRHSLVKNKRGFTLIEVIVVCVIIGIAASIAVPSFGRTIDRMQIRTHVQTAQNVEDTLMSLAGLQYANTYTGNPVIVRSPDYWVDEAAEGSQYVYIVDDAIPGSVTGFDSLFRVAPANIAAIGHERKSAGISEFYKRTMNALVPADWIEGDQHQKNLICSIYYVRDNASNVTGGPGSLSIASDQYVKYKFAYSEYFMTSDGRNYVIYHGVSMHGSTAKRGDPVSGSKTAAEGWHVYEVAGGIITYYGSISV